MTHREALRVSNAVLISALACRALIPGDGPEDHENNTFGLPEGAPVRRTLRKFFREQFERVADFARKVGASVPDRMPSLAHYSVPMAAALTPVLGTYWDKAGKAMAARIGIDPRSWRVTDPEVHAAIVLQSDRVATTMNATTEAQLARVVDDLRSGVATGVIDPDDTERLSAGVASVFADAIGPRAALAGRTEASFAIHAAAGMVAAGSGLAMAGRLATNTDACAICLGIAAEGWVPVGSNALPIPPIHPNCRCSTIYMIEDGTELFPAFVPPTPKKSEAN